MNLTLKEYIESVIKPSLSYHVKYSEFFEKQYEKFSNELIAINFADKPIYFYSWKEEFEEFNKLLKDKKLTYKNKIVGKGDSWEYLIEFTMYFEKGFNSIDYNTPISIIVNKLPFCPTQSCIKPENSNNKIIGIGRTSANSKPCIAGSRPISFDSLAGPILLRANKINPETNVRTLISPKKIAFDEGVMFKSIIQVIERYMEFKDYFEIIDEPSIEFIDVLINGIRELQVQDVSTECIRKIKHDNENNEALFRDWFKTFFAAKYNSVNSEPEKGNGRIDLKIQDIIIGTIIIEFKGWWNTDKKYVTKQIMSYLTDFEINGYIIMINHCKKKNIAENYISLIKTKELGYIDNSFEEKNYRDTGFKYYITKHYDEIRTKTLNHFIINVY